MTEQTSKAPFHSELLMPAGSLEKLKTAILYGADAVYMGTPDMSLRSSSELTLDDVVTGIDFAHQHGKRVYLTLNLYAHNKDIGKLEHYVDTVRKVQPDGLIVADPGVFMYVKQRAPELELHISTQANICSWQSVQFWKDMGAEQVVLAREVTYQELKEIREKCSDIKLEAFIHGAMCMTYSGRCLLSNFMAERGANQGACANSCRWKYKLHVQLKDGTIDELTITEDNQDLFNFLLEEEVRPGEFMEIKETERGAYIFNSRDLCLMPKLPELLEIGIDSLKVEGRSKSPYYAGIVARAYRMAIDDWRRDPENWKPEPYMKELRTVPSRGYTTAFHDGRLTNYSHGYDETTAVADWEYAGVIHDVVDDAFYVQPKNKLVPGDVLEFVSPYRREPLLVRVYDFVDAYSGKVHENANAGQKMILRIPFDLIHNETSEDLIADFPPMTIIRKDRALTCDQWARIKVDKAALNEELEKGPKAKRDADYDAARDELQTALEERDADRSFKTPRLGTGGCCGRGCNGCHIFWHDPQYAKARELLAAKKQGERLDKSMRIKPELLKPDAPILSLK